MTELAADPAAGPWRDDLLCAGTGRYLDMLGGEEFTWAITLVPNNIAVSIVHDIADGAHSQVRRFIHTPKTGWTLGWTARWTMDRLRWTVDRYSCTPLSLRSCVRLMPSSAAAFRSLPKRV